MIETIGVNGTPVIAASHSSMAANHYQAVRGTGVYELAVAGLWLKNKFQTFIEKI